MPTRKRSSLTYIQGFIDVSGGQPHRFHHQQDFEVEQQLQGATNVSRVTGTVNNTLSFHLTANFVDNQVTRKPVSANTLTHT